MNLPKPHNRHSISSFKTRARLSALLLTLACLLLPIDVMAGTGSDADLHDAEAAILLDLQKQPPADAIFSRVLATLDPGILTPDAAYEEPDLSQYLLLGHGANLYLLARRRKSIWKVDPASGKGELLFRDLRPGLLDFSDFTLMGNQTLALADQSRQAVYLFRQRRFYRALGLLDNRWLFPCPQTVFTNDDLSLLGIFDSARNRGFIFSETGQLLSETPGPIEPCFFQNSLVQTQIISNTLRVSLMPRGKPPRTLFTMKPAPGLVFLDVQAIGAAGSTLVLICRQGRGDEDHPTWSKLFVYRQGKVREHSVLPHLRMHSASPKAYALLENGTRLQVVDLEIQPQGVSLRGYSIP